MKPHASLGSLPPDLLANLRDCVLCGTVVSDSLPAASCGWLSLLLSGMVAFFQPNFGQATVVALGSTELGFEKSRYQVPSHG